MASPLVAEIRERTRIFRVLIPVLRHCATSSVFPTNCSINSWHRAHSQFHRGDLQAEGRRLYAERFVDVEKSVQRPRLLQSRSNVVDAIQLEERCNGPRYERESRPLHDRSPAGARATSDFG